MSGGEPDAVVRAITDDGSFRVIAARTTATVQAAIEAQSAHHATAQRFGELLTGAILVRETMSPMQRVQGILQGASGSGSLVADSHPDGTTRGLVKLGAGKEISLSTGALLQVLRSMPGGEIHQGVVEVPEQGGISDALMSYMQGSEQVVSMIAVACIFDQGRVKAAGGYIVQVLPEVGEGPLMLMTERLRDFQNIDELLRSTDADPLALLGELLFGLAHTRLDRRPLHFGCTCDMVRVVGALATLGRTEIEAMVREGKALEVACDYCGSKYQVGTEQLRPLLEAPS